MRAFWQAHKPHRPNNENSTLTPLHIPNEQ
jgi:hypothetical protein